MLGPQAAGTPSSDGRKNDGYWPIPPGFWHGILQVLDRFESLIQHGPGVACVHDPAGILLYASPNVDRMLGYRPVELVGVGLDTLVHPDDLGALDEALEAVGAGPGRSANLVHRLRRKDGTWRWAATRLSNQVANPNVEGVVTHILDITDLREAQEALGEATARLDLVQAFRPTGFTRWNLAADTLRRDARTLAILELPPGSEGSRVFIHLDDRPDYDARWREHLEGRTETCARRYRVLTPDQAWKWVEERVRVVARDADGTPLEALSALQEGDGGAREGRRRAGAARR